MFPKYMLKRCSREELKILQEHKNPEVVSHQLAVARTFLALFNDEENNYIHSKSELIGKWLQGIIRIEKIVIMPVVWVNKVPLNIVAKEEPADKTKMALPYIS